MKTQQKTALLPEQFFIGGNSVGKQTTPYWDYALGLVRKKVKIS